MKDEIKLPNNVECYEKFKKTFKNLSTKELNLLVSNDSVKYYKKGSLVYSEGTRMKGCYFVYSGVVKIFQTGHEGKDHKI